VHQESATRRDDVAGHGLNNNVNETVDSDDTEGHATLNVNETVDSDDDDVEGHTITSNVNETVDSDEDE
jgi:hypothetical protein